MKMASLRSDRRSDAARPGLYGVARADRRIAKLLTRLQPGDVAVIDVGDLDRSTADALVLRRVAAVVNAQPSISGRYPNLGPEVLMANGVALLDDVGAEVFSAAREGIRVRLEGDTLFAGETELVRGTRHDVESVADAMNAAKLGLSAQLEAFAATTQQHMQRERDLLLDGIGIPTVGTKFAGRHVLLVARGYDFGADLKSLKQYLKEFRPILVGVDDGADVLRAAGHKPDLIIGDLSLVSDAALRSAREVVAHADHQGRAPGLARVQDLGIEPQLFASSGTSEDAAMLLADHGKASLIVTVGMRASLEEFLDAGRGGIASTVLTRLKVGGRVVDAKAAAQLFQHRISGWALLLLAVAALVTVVVVLAASDVGDSYQHISADAWHSSVTWVKDIFS